jgi:hypothetical protein
VEYPEEYAEPLRVVAAGVAPIKAVNVEWGTPDYQSVPEYANFTSTFATNCSSEKGNVSTTLSMTESATNSVTVSRSVSTGSSINADLRLNIGKVGSIGTGVRVDRRVTVTQGQTTSETESITRSQTVSIPVRGWSALTMRYGLRRGTGVVPFDAVMTLDGPVDSNLEGFKRISEVLSPEERTFKAKGHVTVEAVSDLDVTWIEDPKKLSAEDPICRERKQPGIGFEERVILIK